MWRFKKEKFNFSGGYLTYHADPKKHGVFVARFKYRNGPVTMSKFRNFLIKNFTVEEYFKASEATSPIQAVMDKGMNIFRSSSYSPDILFPKHKYPSPSKELVK